MWRHGGQTVRTTGPTARAGSLTRTESIPGKGSHLKPILSPFVYLTNLQSNEFVLN
jgi:hypothetical protein